MSDSSLQFTRKFMTNGKENFLSNRRGYGVRQHIGSMFKQPPFVSKKQPFQQLPLMIQVQMHDQTSFYINIFPLWETLLSCPHSRRLGPTYQLFHSRRSVSPNLFQLPKYQNTHNFCYN